MATVEPTVYPATIAGQIERLQKAKADLKTAIEGKGVTVPSNTLLNDYAQKVNLIEQGGGGSSSSDGWAYFYPGSVTCNMMARPLITATNVNVEVAMYNDEMYTQSYQWIPLSSAGDHPCIDGYANMYVRMKLIDYSQAGYVTIPTNDAKSFHIEISSFPEVEGFDSIDPNQCYISSCSSMHSGGAND